MSAIRRFFGTIIDQLLYSDSHNFKLKPVKKLITIFALFFLITSAKAQLPEKAEDISPLLIGEKIPSASISTIDGKMIASTELFNGQKTILIFYRGGWCPYCNTQLGQLQSIEGDLIKMGYQIVAVSPDTPEKLRESLEKIN